jgi:hypothetical protein
MKITITWKAFSNNTFATKQGITSATIELNGMFVDENRETQLCDLIFHETNLYEGSLWNRLEPVLPANRTHTALSVGDEIAITNGDTTRTYRCAYVGWELLEKVGA